MLQLSYYIMLNESTIVSNDWQMELIQKIVKRSQVRAAFLIHLQTCPSCKDSPVLCEVGGKISSFLSLE